MADEQFSIEGKWQGLTVARVTTRTRAPRFKAGEFILIDPAGVAGGGDEVIVGHEILDFEDASIAHAGVIVARLARAPEGLRHG